jgi:hypothetical protein
MRERQLLRFNKFSKDRLYRYILWRSTGTLAMISERGDTPEMIQNRFVLFIGLNPSTADERVNDPTLRRIIQFGRRWEYPWVATANAFAYRATKVSDMKAEDDPVGPENDEAILLLATHAHKIVAAWGKDGRHNGREARLVELIKSAGREMLCLGRNNDGTPVHPLYQPADALLEPFNL